MAGLVDAVPSHEVASTCAAVARLAVKNGASGEQVAKILEVLAQELACIQPHLKPRQLEVKRKVARSLQSRTFSFK